LRISRITAFGPLPQRLVIFDLYNMLNIILGKEAKHTAANIEDDEALSKIMDWEKRHKLKIVGFSKKSNKN
jgi:hypothetical protein